MLISAASIILHSHDTSYLVITLDYIVLKGELVPRTKSRLMYPWRTHADSIFSLLSQLKDYDLPDIVIVLHHIRSLTNPLS